MENEKMLEIAEKIKNQTATEEEVTEFTKSLTALLSGIKKDITK